MEALSHSVSLADLIQKRSAARWTGCSARAFAEAVVAKLEWLCKTESYVADVLGKKAQVKAQYDRAVAANAQCQRGMEVQACEEYGRRKTGGRAGDNPGRSEVGRQTGFPPCQCEFQCKAEPRGIV